MRKRFLLAALGIPFFILGTVVPSALAASYQSGYIKIYGHSTSCALGASSINDSTNKAGAVTENRKGCSHSNAYRNVPAYYIATRAVALQSSLNLACGDSGLRWNTSQDASVTQTAVIVTSAQGGLCLHPGSFRGESTNIRDTDSAGIKTKHFLSPIRIF